MIEKSANQLWKESRTTLSFKNWLNREKKKFVNFNGNSTIIANQPLNESIKSTIGDIRKSVGYKEDTRRNTTFGIPNWVLIGVVLVGVGFGTYQILKKKK
jgi:hypothetical protein